MRALRASLRSITTIFCGAGDNPLLTCEVLAGRRRGKLLLSVKYGVLRAMSCRVAEVLGDNCALIEPLALAVALDRLYHFPAGQLRVRGYWSRITALGLYWCKVECSSSH